MDELGQANRVCQGVHSVPFTVCFNTVMWFQRHSSSLLSALAHGHSTEVGMQGYALIEYRTRDEAEAAIQSLDGSKFLDRTIRVSWAFVKPPTRGGGRRR